MSKYTTELRYLIESQFPLGLDKYPIFDETYRPQLNGKILNHYKFREIGYETAALFADRLNERMDVIMPYYNQLYESAMLKFNPLLNFQSTEETEMQKQDDSNSTSAQHTTQDNTSTTDTTADRTEGIKDTTSGTKTDHEEGNNTESSAGTKDRKEVGSDTPQGLLSIGNIENELYASTAAIGHESDSTKDTSQHTIDATETTSGNYSRDTTGGETSHGSSTSNIVGSTNDSSNSTLKGWQNLAKVIEGFQGISGSKLLNEFRETFLNIDKMVIDELNELFMGIW